ncbi:Rhodanese-like protein [Sistotremastrum suecicum HHB10207 ss-3]|uniref:Rhodanese-like protein n=1 Tax=Sistotremastrum suecicum HHB10207 ss-3 TaxID=1314776 RepID=A0A165Y549_9AGAM|nr:Rhodanese-like protein [Sistotremastrum suecicum HHB10207 ss-3]
MVSSVGYISGQELKEIIKGPGKPGTDYLVVDVRDEDHAGGNITNSAHWPSEEFEEGVHKLIAESKHLQKIVFHCALSQQRGPFAARHYAQIREHEARKSPHDFANQEILILRSGFTGWQQLYKDDAELVVNWDPERWG